MIKPEFPDPVKDWVEVLNSISGDDPEVAHATADEALLEFLGVMGYEEIVHAYNDVSSRCSWWACA